MSRQPTREELESARADAMEDAFRAHWDELDPESQKQWVWIWFNESIEVRALVRETLADGAILDELADVDLLPKPSKWMK